MIHVGGGTLSFYRHWLWSEQACIEAIHVAWLVAHVIWNQFGIHIGSCKKKPEAPQKQSRPEEKRRAAGCQQGTPAVATAVALFYGVCKGSSLIILWAPLISNQPSFVTPCAFLCDIQGVGPCHFIDHGFCQSRHALKQSMWPVWLRTSFETNWEFT